MPDCEWLQTHGEILANKTRNCKCGAFENRLRLFVNTRNNTCEYSSKLLFEPAPKLAARIPANLCKHRMRIFANTRSNPCEYCSKLLLQPAPKLGTSISANLCKHRLPILANTRNNPCKYNSILPLHIAARSITGCKYSSKPSKNRLRIFADTNTQNNPCE